MSKRVLESDLPKKGKLDKFFGWLSNLNNTCRYPKRYLFLILVSWVFFPIFLIDALGGGGESLDLVLSEWRSKYKYPKMNPILRYLHNTILICIYLVPITVALVIATAIVF